MSADPRQSGELEGVIAQLLRLPAGEPHAVKAVTRFKMILVMIRA